MSDLAAAVLAGDRGALARAITLVESTSPRHAERARALLAELLPHAGAAVRLGISGVPGVGKSTFIDELGSQLTASGHRVAVLAVDPSSTATSGSVLGDKTRMARLAVDDAAFVRPSPSAGTLGGVTRATREVMVVLEAAGYDVLLVETVGVGQSETAVADMVDTFLLLTLARTGDQLQGIKRGILELADVIAVNKADGEHAVAARQAARELSGALRMVVGGREDTIDVLTCSAVTGDGVAAVWEAVGAHREQLVQTGQLERKRSEQQVGWMWAAVEDQLLRAFREDAGVAAELPAVERQVRNAQLGPGEAADQLIRTFRDGR
ncbi:MAG: methylmalonyl Co-A mutase-associated GTPase MeaB [Actinomycetia bacterium]|nr:methylmalonyl Co-A mutase-associated GTPase MeaB [Actinomycetes bacterium]